MRGALVPIVMLVLLAVPPAADAARRYASPAGSTTATCAAADPCALEVAVNSAADGDEVVVTPGTYTVAKRLQPRGTLDLHGDPNFAWPHIVGAGTLKEPVLTLDGGTLAHVSIHASVNKEALILKEGVVDGVRLESVDGDAATVYGSDATVIRNSVVHSSGAVDSAALWLRDGSGVNSVVIRNVSALIGGLHGLLFELPARVLDRRHGRHRQPECGARVRRRRLPARRRLADDRRRPVRHAQRLERPRRPRAHGRRRAGHRCLRVRAAAPDRHRRSGA